MANKKKPAAPKAKQPAAEAQVPVQHVAEYILSFQDKKFTEQHINNLMKIYEAVCVACSCAIIA